MAVFLTVFNAALCMYKEMLDNLPGPKVLGNPNDTPKRKMLSK
jgi:hypothetical protein